MRFSIHPHWSVSSSSGAAHSLSRLFSLLNAIEKTSNLKIACAQCLLSYRHGWGSIREAEMLFKTSIVEMTRGKGTLLTPFGKKLLWGEKRVIARLAPLLESMASELETELDNLRMAADPVLHMHASHGYAVAMLYAKLQEAGLPIELDYRGSLDAVRALSRGDCDIAGFHVPLGKFEPIVFRQFANLIDGEKHRLIFLSSRRLGLMVPKGNPRGIWSINDIQHAQFVNRQPGSGTRVITELVLDAENINPAGIRGYDRVEFTHAAIAAYVASGKADVGLGVEPAARLFDLDFVPILSERYFFLCDRKNLEQPQVQQLIRLLQDTKFKSAVNQLPGYDALNAGAVLTIEQGFPDIAHSTT